MTIKLFFGVSITTTVLILIVGCTVSHKPIFKPKFERSNIIQIEKSIHGLEMVNSIRSVISRNHKLVIASMEKPYSGDSLVSHLIEDNLITNLSNIKYNVLERDEDLIYRLMSESEKKYRVIVEPHNLENLDFNIQSADKILSYRVLECGILLESSKNRTYRNGGLDNIRHARTKLHIRVIDAKTGRIEFATILENEVDDIIPSGLAQTLSKIHFTYHDYNLPNLGGQVQSTKTISSKGVNSTSTRSSETNRGFFYRLLH